MAGLRCHGILVVRTVEDVLDRNTAERVLAVMRDYGFIPERISLFEPVKPPFREDLFVEHWVGYGFPGGLSGSNWDADFIGKGGPGLDFMTWMAYAARHSRRTLVFDLWTRPRVYSGSRHQKSEEELVRLSQFGQALCAVTRAVFGFVTPDERGLSIDRPKIEGDMNELSTFLPGLHWVTFIGSPWIDTVRQRTAGVPGLIQEVSGGILTLRLDAGPLSQEVLSGELASRIGASLQDQLFVRGSLPPVSCEKLWAKADSVLTAPPEAKGIGTASWSEIASPYQGTPLPELVEILAKKGQELGKVLGIKMDFTERSMSHLGKWLLDVTRVTPPAACLKRLDFLARIAGRRCGEIWVASGR